jgi:predicted GNAT family acetyltransferase
MHYYQTLLDQIGLPYSFLDVVENEAFAMELRSLYANGKLNFPTITIGTKKLRNPRKEELLSWMHKLIPSMIQLQHNSEARQYVLEINEHKAVVNYEERNGKLYLVHAEVPYNLRGRGIGEELVLKTFEKLTEAGHKAVGICSFVRAVRDRHPEWKNSIE